MQSLSLWKLAPSPNYLTNVNLQYPYSETPYLGEYQLVKIPLSLNDLLPHVDYWGEGRVVSERGASGFTNSYNVNCPLQLVSTGSDKDKKIPNRIPVRSSTDCDTSAYVKDNSVALVTVMGAPITSSCAVDIARMVNADLGRVVLYGYDTGSNDIQYLTTKLAKKSLYHCPDYKLPAELQNVNAFKTHIAFTNVTLSKQQLHNFVINGQYDNAISLTKSLANEVNGESISELVGNLLNGDVATRKKLMSFAYKLWVAAGKDIVRNYFPKPIQLVFSKEYVKIVNKGYYQALKLDANTDSYHDRLTWGDASDKTSIRVSWQFLPVWTNNEVTFKIYNIDCNMYLKLDATPDGIGDRILWGSTASNEDRHQYYVEPYMRAKTPEFHIINYKYHQGLKLAADVRSYGDRLAWGHNGDIYKDEGRFKWIISEWS